MELLTTGITFFQKGGIVMYVLLLCSLFVFSIGIERAMYFRRMDSGRAFARDFYLALANNKWQKAEQLADHARGALADILFAVITKKPEARKNPSAYMEIQSGIALAKLRKRLYYLSVIVTMAPLLGLLGTQRHDHLVLRLQSGVGAADGHHGRRRRGTYCDGHGPLRRHHLPDGPRVLLAAHREHRHGHGAVLLDGRDG